MQIEIWAITRPIPYARNPRLNAGAVAKVAASLEAFGWQQPLVVDAEGVVIVGHTRLEAAKRLGWKDCPVYIASHLTPAQAKAYRLIDNRSAEEAEWDTVKLAEEIEALQLAAFPVALTGFDVPEIAELLRARGELLEPRGNPEDRKSVVSHERVGLKWTNKVVPLTPEEVLMLDQAWDQHTTENPDGQGFVNVLLGEPETTPCA
jgi:hypothetical protein